MRQKDQERKESGSKSKKKAKIIEETAVEQRANKTFLCMETLNLKALRISLKSKYLGKMKKTKKKERI